MNVSTIIDVSTGVVVLEVDRVSCHFVSGVVATAGLVLVIFALARTGRAANAPVAVGAYIGTAYFFTSSTSFANPAITVGRMFSDTFAGIAPSSAPLFIAAQILGGIGAFAVIKTLYPASPRRKRPMSSCRTNKGPTTLKRSTGTAIATRASPAPRGWPPCISSPLRHSEPGINDTFRAPTATSRQTKESS